MLPYFGHQRVGAFVGRAEAVSLTLEKLHDRSGWRVQLVALSISIAQVVRTLSQKTPPLRATMVELPAQPLPGRDQEKLRAQRDITMN